MVKNNSGLGCLISFVALGFFLLFYNRVMIFSPFFITIMVGVVLVSIMLFSLGIKSRSEGNNDLNIKNSSVKYHRNSTNPYVLQNNNNTLQTQVVQKEIVKQKPIISNYCQFCGVKRENDAIYCHNCGTKLDLE